MQGMEQAQEKSPYIIIISSLLGSSKCLRAFQPYSDENNPWEFDGAVRVGIEHEFMTLGDVDEEINYHYTPEFKRPVSDPVS
jgi:hypothetical protein